MAELSDVIGGQLARPTEEAAVSTIKSMIHLSNSVSLSDIYVNAVIRR